MKVLVIGAGMYVTGRNNSGEGTILASLAQISREIDIEVIDIVARNPKNSAIIRNAADRINQKLGSHLNVCYHPVASVSEYLSANNRYEAAIIAVPDHLHFEIAKTVLEHNIHCLMVKPLTPVLEEAQELVRIQKERGLYAAVEFHKRFDESNLLVKKVIIDHAVGDVRYFVINYSQRISIPLVTFREWSAKTNIFQYLGVHYVDLIYFLTGARPSKVMAIGTQGVLSGYGLSTYDSIHALIVWDGPDGRPPFITSMNVGWIDPKFTSALSDQSFILVGSRGTIKVDQKNRGIELVTDESGTRHPNPYFSEYLPTIDGGLEFQGYGLKSIRQFIDDVRLINAGKINPKELDSIRPSFSQGLISTLVIDAVNVSLSKSSEWIDLHGLS